MSYLSHPSDILGYWAQRELQKLEDTIEFFMPQSAPRMEVVHFEPSEAQGWKPCSICGKLYHSAVAVRKHEQKAHNHLRNSHRKNKVAKKCMKCDSLQTASSWYKHKAPDGKHMGYLCHNCYMNETYVKSGASSLSEQKDGNNCQCWTCRQRRSDGIPLLVAR